MIQAVIFDWAGTTVYYGCFAPVQAFQEASPTTACRLPWRRPVSPWVC